MPNPDENRVLDAVRRQYQQDRADLAAFDEAFHAQDFEGWTLEQMFGWCHGWWEIRLAGRTLDHGERRLKGTQGRN